MSHLRRTRLVALLTTVSTLIGLSALAVVPANASGLSLSPRVGPPTTKVGVAGSGFGAAELVDVYFDTTVLALATTDRSGGFTTTIQVPRTAVPGTHWIVGVARSSRASAQAGFLVRTNWAQFHFWPNHGGRNPYENVLSPWNVGRLAVDWSFTTGSRVSSSPAVANGVVYVGSEDNYIHALNASTGTKRWSFNSGSFVTSAPAVRRGTVFVTSKNLYALNAWTGALRWSFPIDVNYHSSPTVKDGVVYFGSGKNVYAVNASTGAKLWSFPTGGAVYSTPSVEKGVVYVGSWQGDCSLYALNAGTGAKIWSFNDSPNGCTGGIAGSPAVVGGVVYVDSVCGIVYALKASTGAKLWSHAISGVSIFSSPAVAMGRVYVGTGGGIFALSASTGAQLWKLRTGARVDTSPAFANGVVYFGAQDGNVYALKSSTGATLWSYFTVYNGVFSSPAVANGFVYIGSDDHNVYAFHLPRAAEDVPRP